MKTCTQCSTRNVQDVSFCSNCGAPLPAGKSGIPPERRAAVRRERRRFPILPVALVLAIASAAFAIYSASKAYGKEAVADRFVEAVIEKDQASLKEMIVPKDGRIAVDDDSLQAFLTLIEKNPSFVQDIEDSLKGTSSNNMFTLRPSGKHYGVFPKYTVNPVVYTVAVDAPGESTVYSVGDTTLGELTHEGDQAEYGPFLAGIYPLTVTSVIEAEEVTKQFAIRLHGLDSSMKLADASSEVGRWNNEIAEARKVQAELAEAEKEEAEKETKSKDTNDDNVVERVVFKEVVKEVPVVRNDYYIIPYSGDTYLSAYDLQGLTKKELRIARNEIYARYGYVFDSKDLQSYFNAQQWYTPNSTYDGYLTDWEKHNVDLIKSFE